MSEQRGATTAKAMQATFGGMARSRMALETGMHSPLVSRLLSGLGHEVIVAHARKVESLIQECGWKDGGSGDSAEEKLWSTKTRTNPLDSDGLLMEGVFAS